MPCLTPPDTPPAGATRPGARQPLPEACTPQELGRLFRRSPLTDLGQRARNLCEGVHGNAVYLRGLIEFTNYCTSNCQYCGIRRDNVKVPRYRMAEEQILDTVQEGVKMGFKTFVLQGGEDPRWTVDRICRLVGSIKTATQNRAAVTLSCGMKSRDAYRRFTDAGADRYLLRFETSDPMLHARLRDGQTLDQRLEALDHIRSAGFQVGSGFMTGLPGETAETRLDNVLLCQTLGLDMVGIGPFIPHPDTPLADQASQGIEPALQATALVRLALPLVHMPATTAAGSIAQKGREQMILHGANVLMPNMTPAAFKKSYLLYPGKICIEESCARSLADLKGSLFTVGRTLSFQRADAVRLPLWGHSHHPKGGRYG